MIQDLFRLLPEEVDTLIGEYGAPAYRGRQLLHALYRDLHPSLDAMTTLPLMTPSRP